MTYDDVIELLVILAGSMALVDYMFTRLRTGYMKQDAIDFFAYQFTSVIEDKVADGEVTREDATEAYRRLKQLFPTRELYPSVGWLKSSIQKRRSNGHHDPVLLPGERLVGFIEKVELIAEPEKKILPAFQKRRP